MSDFTEYIPGTTFPGIIGRTVAESSPDWPGTHFAPKEVKPYIDVLT
jgi:hypothetical protein